MTKENIARYIQFALVIVAAGSIYPLIYLKAQYQETILEVFGMTLTQMNTIYSVIGLVFIAGYFPSGLLSDKFSAKNLLSISLLGTSMGGFWFAQVPSYDNVLIIFSIWGFFSVFTFWCSHLKIVKMLSAPGEEGKFFGLLDGGKGLIEALLASIALALFSYMLNGGTEAIDKKEALVTIIYMYSSVLLATSILIFIFVNENKKENVSTESEADNSFKFSDLSKVLSNKLVYLQGAIIFAGYTVFWASYYYGGYLQSNVGLDPISVGTIMVMVLWMRPIGGILGGYLADKIGRTLTIGSSLVGGSICLGLLVATPQSTPIAMISALVALTGLFAYTVRGTYWSLLGDAKIDATIMGTAIGVISLLGYLPDIAIPQLNTYLWQSLGEKSAYEAYFIVSMITGLLGAIFVYLFHKLQSNEASQIVENNRINTDAISEA
ncbi:MAG: MFS transporter [Shewanella sp.]|uniref:MFS transporter n=1 Tax=Shewanella sp. TaxID=50422 RepID=UPI003F3C181E